MAWVGEAPMIPSAGAQGGLVTVHLGMFTMPFHLLLVLPLHVFERAQGALHAEAGSADAGRGRHSGHDQARADDCRQPSPGAGAAGGAARGDRPLRDPVDGWTRLGPADALASLDGAAGP